MWRQESDVLKKDVVSGTGPDGEKECTDIIPLIRQDYERCHPDDTFDDLKRRTRFSKEDRGLLRDWMALATERTSQGREQGVARRFGQM
jgi:hypothetical protein